MEYVNLHTHTEFSNITAGLDSINRLDSLVSYSQSIGLSGLAITEHDNLSGIIRVNHKQKELQKAGNPFKLIQGNEIYLVEEFEDNDKKDVKRRYYHFILIAKDRLGFQALIDISSKAWLRSAIQRGRRRVPTLYSDIEEVFDKLKCQGHIVASTACLGGFLPQLLLKEDYDAANKFIKWGQQVFGKDDFFIEYQSSKIPDQLKFNSCASIAYPNTPKIITTDAHYLRKDKFDIFEAFMRSQQESREIKEYYDDAYIQSSEEIFEKLKDNLAEEEIRAALENTKRIAEQVEFYDLEQKPRIPKVNLTQLPKEKYDLQDYPTLEWAASSKDLQTKYCIDYCLKSLKERNLWTPKYLIRLEEEFDTFKFQSEAFDDNFFAYFNTMQHYIEMAWSIDCAVGPSRGSASGSLLCYLMDVVQCDPLQYSLPFWRFANKVRTSPLDIDTDFQPSKRDDFFKAIRAERGDLGLTQVATFRTLTLKAAIGNAARGYKTKNFPNGLDADISTYISSLIEVRRGQVATLQQSLKGDEITGFSINHKFIKEVKVYPGLLDIIEDIEKIIVNSSTHAAAVILFDEEDSFDKHCSLMRSPNGDLCTALDLHDVEEAGCYKYDYLILSTLDIMSTCFSLLKKDNQVDPNLSLKECYRKYINPNTIDFDQKRIWESLYNNEVLRVFQWDAQSGRKGILATKPQNLFELTSVNGLIRLMTEAGTEDQIQRFAHIKANPKLFEQEMIEVGLNEEQRQIMHEELDQYNGCAATQESFMVLSQRLANYTLKEADALRKTVAKKKMSEITMQKELFYSKLIVYSDKVRNYLWQTIVAPSLGYGFSLNHALPYSIIGVQCILLGSGILFHPIYWKTACLLQQSGSLDGKSADYNKIAKAVGSLKDSVNILPISINQSNREFTLNRDKNEIYFGLDAIKGLGEKVKNAILEERKNGLFESFEDFIDRAKPDVTSVISIFLSGGFSDFDLTNEELKQKIFNAYGKPKEKVNGQNLLQISRLGLWPAEDDENRRIFNCLQHLKKLTPKDIQEMDYWITDDKSAEFLIERGYAPDEDGAIEKELVEDLFESSKDWIKQYVGENEEALIEQINSKLYEDFSSKYFSSMPSVGEIETMGICFAEHPLKSAIGFKVDDEHGVRLKRFEDLSEEPKVAHEFVKDGRTIPMYKLDAICGCVIAKDKLHHSFTLLTKDMECIEVALRKEVFAHYDAQISIKLADGHKKVIEKSWLNRGSQVVVHGMRDGDIFRGKKYKNSKMQHELYKILDLSSIGEITYQKERKTGIKEEPEEN